MPAKRSKRVSGPAEQTTKSKVSKKTQNSSTGKNKRTLSAPENTQAVGGPEGDQLAAAQGKRFFAADQPQHTHSTQRL